MKKKFKILNDLQIALRNAIKEAEKEIKNNPPVFIAKKNKDKPKELIVNIFLKKWWDKKGVNIMEKIASDFYRSN